MTAIDPDIIPGELPWPPDLSVKFLTLWEPWASAIPAGLKTVETRGYSSPFRGWVMIHAGVHKLTKAERAALPPGIKRAMLDLDMHPGHVVALARIADIVPTDHHHTTFGSVEGWQQVRKPSGPVPGAGGVPGRPAPTHLVTKIGAAEMVWGNYSPGRYAWLLANIVKLPEPVPMKGDLGLKTPPLHVLEAVLEQIKNGASWASTTTK